MDIILSNPILVLLGIWGIYIIALIIAKMAGIDTGKKKDK